MRITLTVHFAGVRRLLVCSRAGSRVKKDRSGEFDQAGECGLAPKADIVCPAFPSHRRLRGLRRAHQRRGTPEQRIHTAAAAAALLATLEVDLTVNFDETCY